MDNEKQKSKGKRRGKKNNCQDKKKLKEGNGKIRGKKHLYQSIERQVNKQTKFKLLPLKSISIFLHPCVFRFMIQGQGYENNIHYTQWVSDLN